MLLNNNSFCFLQCIFIILIRWPKGASLTQKSLLAIKVAVLGHLPYPALRLSGQSSVCPVGRRLIRSDFGIAEAAGAEA